jgi:hypothetical protein
MKGRGYLRFVSAWFDGLLRQLCFDTKELCLLALPMI